MAAPELTLFITLLLVAPPNQISPPQTPPSGEKQTAIDLQQRHIVANVPADDTFSTLLGRDIRAYLAANELPSNNLEIESLRRGPTQSGAAYPKYYLWIRATDDAGNVSEGAMRVAAIDRARFEITDFVTASSIRSDPSSLASIFPALIIPAIRQRAAAE